MTDSDRAEDESASESWGLMADLDDAVERGDAEAVAALLRAGADPEAVAEIEDPTALMRAAEAGNLSVVRALVEGGANVNAEACDGELDRFLDDDEAEAVGSSVTALLYAALRDHREVYEYLHPLTRVSLRREVDRARNVVVRLRKPKRNRRLRGLVEAARNGKADEVRALLDAGIDVNARDSHQASGLWYAVAFRHTVVAEMLLAAGADPNLPAGDGRAPLHVVEDAAVAQRLLTAGADPNAKGQNGHTPLMFAAMSGSAELVRVLIAAGAELDAVDFQGSTALILAAQSGMTETAAALIAAGATLWARNDLGLTAYRAARGRKHEAVADLLRKAGAFRETSLQLFRASAEGRHDVVEQLLAGGADACDSIEAEPDFMLTALHGAARAGHADTVRALLGAGADVHAKTLHFTDRSRSEMTPLLLAASEGHAEVIRALLDAGAKPDATSFFFHGVTPLMRAAEGGHLDAVCVLLDAGADPYRTGGAEPLDAVASAERNGHAEVVERLRQARH